MDFRSGLSLSLVLFLYPFCARGAVQEWDPIKSASGWASFDRDGSCVFHDPAAGRLLAWSRDSGVTGTVDLAKVNGRVDAWVLDPLGSAWVAAGTNLQLVDKSGKTGSTHTLPAEVGDLAWDTRTFLLCYRTRDPYLELRDMKTGAVIWSHGPRPPKGASYPLTRHHVAIMEDGRILLATGDSFQLEILDPAKGTSVSTLAFSCQGQPCPTLRLGEGDRGALAWWLNNNTAFMAVPASQLPGGGFQGLLLARLDLAKRVMTLLPTGADEKAVLVGIQEDNAVLRNPGGGLVFFPIP